MANITLILGIALLIAGAALVVTGVSLIGTDFVSWLSAAMPLVPGAMMIAWASRLKHKNRVQSTGE